MEKTAFVINFRKSKNRVVDISTSVSPIARQEGEIVRPRRVALGGTP